MPSVSLPTKPALTTGFGGPFDLADGSAYARWREHKLSEYPASVDELIVPVEDPLRLRTSEHAAMLRQISRANMAVYQLGGDAPAAKSTIRRLGEHFGLRRLDDNLCADEDSVTTLRVVDQGRHRGYIPYTNRRLNWHTDGYYNPPGHTVRAILMHCVMPAEQGGANGLLDHEMAYLLMRDRDPGYIEALMQPDVMTIPPNTEGGETVRGAQSGPVFSIDPSTGALHMRYTARTRSIEWKNESVVREATECLGELLSRDSGPVLWHRLEAGQGLISNNVLHCRTGFTDSTEPGARRVLYRARYYDRIDMTPGEG
jgi:hypothetical protein